MIAFFYSGLGLALFLCGVRFLGIFARKDVLTLTHTNRPVPRISST
jgi:hypothetical protein